MPLDKPCSSYAKCPECDFVGLCPNREDKLKEALEHFRPFRIQGPTNPLRPFQPYPSKYYDDHRYDPSREATIGEIIYAHKRLLEDNALK